MDWAEAKGKKVLVVSADKGCLAACEESTHLVGRSSLLDALADLRVADQQRRNVIEVYGRLLAVAIKDRASNLRNGIDDWLFQQVPDLEVEVDAEADREVPFDHAVDELKLLKIEPVSDGLTGEAFLRILNVNVGELTFVAEFYLTVEVSARFFRTYGKSGASSTRFQAPVVREKANCTIETVVTLQTSGAVSEQSLASPFVRRVDITTSSIDVDFGVVDAWEPGYEE